MKELLADGGLVDFVTLHPLGALLVVVAAVFAVRWVASHRMTGHRHSS